MPLSRIYRHSLALLTDLYELTMAAGYWSLGRAEVEAVFDLSFRRHPFEGGYTITAGLAYAIDYLVALRFEPDDLAWLAELTGAGDAPLFDPRFLDYLGELRLTCDIDAIPEGTVVFPHQPLVRVRGPILQCQLLETALLNIINFQTLVATKAARTCSAAGDTPVIEFGLRRAQGIDGALAASRAAWIGGCAATSNVLAGRLFGIPVKGTHAHSWVMSFASELEAFEGWVQAMPHNSVLLVDTYDTLEGVRHAIEAGRTLRRHGHELAGIRLDSGDLAWLGGEARRMLDEARFPDAVIMASSDLDEHLIDDIRKQGAPIGAWGVGTRLVTGHEQPALGGVYKLTAVRDDGGAWRSQVKLSEQAVKISTPGIHRVRRYHDGGGRFIADMIYDEQLGIGEPPVIVDPLDLTRRKQIERGTAHEELLVPIMRTGEIVYDPPPLEQSRARTAAQLRALDPTIRRLVNPHEYPAGLELRLHELKTKLVLEERQRFAT